MKRLIGLTCWAWGLVALAAPSPWFDAGIDKLESWPTDGRDVTIEGEGRWTGTDNATLADQRLKVDAGANMSLGFEPGVQKGIADATLVYAMTTRFSLKDGLPEREPEAKCGLSAIEDQMTLTTNYCGLVKDPEGDGNIWAVLSGATPDPEADVELTITMKAEGARAFVRYTVGEAVLMLKDTEWIEVAMPKEMSGKVCFGGNGAVASLSATAESAVPVEMKALTIPAVEHLAIKSVAVAGKAIEPDEDGVYHVEKGSLVTVVFAPETGWALTGKGEVAVVVKDDMTFPEASIPGALDVAKNITINEVMAKNGVTIRTKKGYEGLDWVELYNSSDDDLVLTNPDAPYYMGNDPTKATSKWLPIQGACVVPAKGYKIVWFDGDGLCPDSGFAPDEAFVRANLSTDAGKHTVFLASAADKAKIVQQITLPGGIKDISYGIGHLSRTLVAANALAEYRVGEGAWTRVDGPVGMSAQAGGFTARGYKANRSVATMDDANAVIANPETWIQAETNEIQTVAFMGSGTSGNFDGSLYSGFFAGATGDNIVYQITGVILIPEAGDWTFSVGSDDGFSAKLTRLDKSYGWENPGSRGYAQSPATFNLAAGAYEVDLRYFNGGGGSGIDFSVAKGRLNNFDASKFKLVGATESEVVHAGALGAQVAANVADEMLGLSTTCEWKTSFTLDEAPAEDDVIRLLVRYADGFTAKVNGETVVTVPSTGARTPSEALMRQSYEIPAAKLQKGLNTLELVGENDRIDDTEFFLGAELVRDIADDVFVYFETPTPGKANGGNGRTGFTSKVGFSVPHGWKEAAFDLELTCVENPAAVIYYTLDGTSPKVGAEGTFRYEEPIQINKTTVVRAAVPDVDSILQQDASATYLFYEDVIRQDASVPAGFPASGAVNSQAMMYGLAKAITEGDADTQARLKRGFTENTRTVSLVIDPKNLFDGASGIYVNASGNGRDWERQTMAEQINPMVADGSDDFSVAAGLRIRGAFSRGAGNPKHSFRLFFRSEYGMGTLEHPLFGNEAGAAKKFEKIDFRTSQNYAWAQNSDGDTFIHETWSRDSERDLGSTYNRSRYYNLFINGVYWGLYQTEERVDQNYCESYNGGVAENYDVVRTSQPGYNTGIVEGDSAAWTELWRITTQEGYGPGHEANFKKVLGLNPDGTRNADYPVLLNVTNLICHIFTAHFAQDSDSPVNSGGMANNIIAFRNRNDGEGKENGFLWNRHDAEHSLGYGGGANDLRALTYGTEEHLNTGRDLRAIGNFNPNLLNYELLKNAEYRQIFSDLVYTHMVKPGGALTTEAAIARYEARMAELDDVIVCESARWGYQYGGSHNRALWLRKCNERLDFIRNRLRYLIPEYQRRGWYTSTEAPQLVDGMGAPVEEGTTIGKDEKIFLSAGVDGAQVYYTLDGTDPRGADGQPTDGATLYTGGSPVPVAVPLFAKGSEWKYDQSAQLPAANWTAADFDDAAWPTGSAFGFGSVNKTTELKRYVDGSSGTQITTFYFRKTVTLPKGAEKMTSLTGTAYCDDGYVAYVNGVEAGRDNMPAGEVGYATYASGAINPTDKATTWAFPAGTLHEGENVIAVEVHQCNAGSSDIAWDLALGYLKADDSATGLSVPPTGLALTMRVLGANGEWSALATISVKGEEILSTQVEAVRVAAVYSSTKDAKGDDDSEFIVLTNITEHAVLLDGLGINAAKAGNALASLCTLTGGRLEAGSSVTLTKAANWPTGKLTNGVVDMELLDSEGALVQKLGFSSKWFDGIADGTGDYLVAKDFGTPVTEQSQWKPSESWVEKNLRFYALDGITAKGTGDTDEYFVLTNLSDKVTLDLSGVKVNVGKSSDMLLDESSSKCIVTIGEMTLAPGASVRFDQAIYWPGSKQKITNGELILKIYDAEGAQVQVSTLNQKNFNGYYGAGGPGGEQILRATSFERETTTADWIEVDPPKPADWPEDPETGISDTTAPTDFGITAGAFATATPAELKKLAKWAKTHQVPYAGEAVNGLAFADTGYTDFEKAYLLNCALSEVAEKEAAFKFEAIVPGETPTIGGDFNGTLTVWGATTLENGGDWAKEKADAHFFKATLTR